jgi:hypothetical protein
VQFHTAVSESPQARDARVSAYRDYIDGRITLARYRSIIPAPASIRAAHHAKNNSKYLLTLFVRTAIL